MGAAPPFTGVAVNVTLVPSQMEPAGTPAIVTDGTVMETVMVTLSVSEGGTAQLASEISTTLITLPLDKFELVYVLLVAPGITEPLFSHWYCGLTPPLAITVVKLAGSDSQIESFGLTVRTTEGITLGITVIVTASVSVKGATQDALEVITTLTISLSASVVVENGFAVDTAVPFTNHWNAGTVPPKAVLFAVNVAVASSQTWLFAGAVIVTMGTSGMVRFATILLESVAGLGQAALEVITTSTTSPLRSVEVVKVEVVAPPTLILFTCHW